jgi:hypothetical protein
VVRSRSDLITNQNITVATAITPSSLATDDTFYFASTGASTIATAPRSVPRNPHLTTSSIAARLSRPPIRVRGAPGSLDAHRRVTPSSGPRRRPFSDPRRSFFTATDK